jgi:hypothetical protein
MVVASRDCSVPGTTAGSQMKTWQLPSFNLALMRFMSLITLLQLLYGDRYTGENRSSAELIKPKQNNYQFARSSHYLPHL